MTALAPTAQATDPAVVHAHTTPVAPLLPAYAHWISTVFTILLAMSAGATGIWALTLLALAVAFTPALVEVWWAWVETRQERIAGDREYAQLAATSSHR